MCFLFHKMVSLLAFIHSHTFSCNNIKSKNWKQLNSIDWAQYSWINSIFGSLLRYYRLVMLFCCLFMSHIHTQSGSERERAKKREETCAAIHFVLFFPLSHCSFRNSFCLSYFEFSTFTGKFTVEKWMDEKKKRI